MDSTTSSPSIPTTISMKKTPSLMDLPTELHLLITKELIYPDALALKHTNRYFNALTYTSEILKIEWLIQRRRLHLDCLNDRKCELGSDTRFCRGSVQLLMKRRREHGECETRPGGRGCLVLGTAVCEVRREKLARDMLKWRLGGLLRENMMVRWVLVALLGAVVALAGGWAILEIQSMKNDHCRIESLRV